MHDDPDCAACRDPNCGLYGCMKVSPTGRTRPLTGGMVNKGGHNAFPSQITQRPPPPGPSRIRGDTVTLIIKEDTVDFAHLEMHAVFMAGWDACFAKRDAEGNVPADADDREAAQAAFLEFVKSYGGK